LFKITEKTFLQESVIRMVLEAPEIARKRKAGQFVVLMIDEKGRGFRLPSSIPTAERGR